VVSAEGAARSVLGRVVSIVVAVVVVTLLSIRCSP
jgi:hypothetical protein